MAILSATKSIQRVQGRGLLLSTLEKDVIPTRVRVFCDGRFTIETKLWDEYWQPVHGLDRKKVEESLDKLHIAWHDYIHSRFNISLRGNFCYHYFTLFDILLSLRKEFTNRVWLRAIQAALGFECFGIASAVDSEVLAAGTCTLRNPCYLLAKLKMPNVLDDPQFLPVITVPDTEEPELFYHYRQYIMSRDFPISLLLYPAVSEDKRLASFKLISSLVGGVSHGIDPRTQERARRFCQTIIFPLLGANSLNGVGPINLELVDIGAGSGSLSAAICREIKNIGFKPELRLWFVDLELADPVRFFYNKTLRAFTDNLIFVGNDYRDWLIQTRPLPAKNGLRIALVSKLFNNLSNFSVRYLSNEQAFPVLESMTGYSDTGTYRPSICLAPRGSGVNSLAISNMRIQVQEGRAFSQLSLSEFYRGLYLLLRKANFDESIKADLFLPVRSFNPACLVTKEGKSIISILAENSDYVIIEDADLRPQDLIDHLTKHSLSALAVCNMTRALGLKGNYLYTLWTRKAVDLQLAGERIW